MFPHTKTFELDKAKAKSVDLRNFVSTYPLSRGQQVRVVSDAKEVVRGEWGSVGGGGGGVWRRGHGEDLDLVVV
jgi:hypothetical protein